MKREKITVAELQEWIIKYKKFHTGLANKVKNNLQIDDLEALHPQVQYIKEMQTRSSAMDDLQSWIDGEDWSFEDER